jgi:hypothetical protein
MHLVPGDSINKNAFFTNLEYTLQWRDSAMVEKSNDLSLVWSDSMQTYLRKLLKLTVMQMLIIVSSCIFYASVQLRLQQTSALANTITVHSKNDRISLHQVTWLVRAEAHSAVSLFITHGSIHVWESELSRS